jgi:hypothetical protein
MLPNGLGWGAGIIVQPNAIEIAAMRPVPTPAALRLDRE